MEFIKIAIYNLKKFFSGWQLYISFLFFAITNVNDLRADILFQAGKDQYFDAKSIVKLENKNFIPILEPKSEFECSWGATQTLKDFRGKFVILYFWATWCNNCVERLKTLYALKDELEYQNVNDILIIPMSTDFKDINSINAYLSASKIADAQFCRDKSKELTSSFGINNVPIAVLIDKNGYVVNKLSGDINWNSKNIIEQLLAMKGEDQIIVPEQTKSEEKVGDQSNASDIITNNKKPIIIE